MLHINRLILGTAQFGLDYGINNTVGKLTRKEVIQILHYAYDAGIRILDTAEAYGDAIQAISEYQQTSSDKFEIISKFKYFDGIDIQQIILKTIKSLDVEKLFCFMFHSVDDLEKHPELLNKIYSMRSAGLIEHIGASIYTNEQFERIIGTNHIDLVQLPYNLLDNDLQRGSMINKAKKMGKVVHVRSVFLQGLFFKDAYKIDSSNVLFPLKDDISYLQRLVKDEKISMTALALQYPFDNSSIDGVLFGVDTLSQLTHNIEEFNRPVNQKVFKTINGIDVERKDLLLPTNWE